MKYADMFNENEKPLDNWVENGGFVRIFKRVGCIGDSLSSGEFESLTAEGVRSYHDMFEYSWGQVMARACGFTAYNFSRGGMSAKWYIESYADEKDFWNADKACQAYIMALGVNDLFGARMAVGTANDVDCNGDTHPETFAYYFCKIIERYKQIQPDAKFFLVTIPNKSGWGENYNELADAHQKFMYDIAEKYDNMYVLDIRKYAPAYEGDFTAKLFMSGHMNAMGYVYTADMFISYIDYIIRHNMNDFKTLPFIGTDIVNVSVEKK